MVRPSGAVFATLLAFGFAPPDAAAQDLDLMLKWSQAEVIHYDVVAEFSGEVPVLRGSQGFYYSAQVRDRIEISFDWSPTQLKLLGKPTFKNFPSTMPADIFANACSHPPVTSPYDHFEITGVKDMAGAGLELTGKRTFAAGHVPYRNEEGKCGLDPAPAGTETVTSEEMASSGVLLALPGTYFAMPASLLPNNLKVGTDGQTMVMTDKGWTYTYKMRVGK